MLQFIGSNGSLALFGGDSKGVVIDTTLNLVVETGDVSELSASREWADGNSPLTNELYDLVSAAIVTSNVETIVASSTRMYTIPGGVQAEAKKALNWRREAKRGGTPVGLNTARTLAKGGQIGIEKIRHIAKYFPRHEVDKKGKGWAPGEEHFPSNGRIAWALWGGDAGQRWAAAIVERENKKALTAGGYEIPGYEAAIEDYSTPKNDFKVINELDENYGPEFIARIRHDGEGIDRLYKVELDGSVHVWDDCCWDNLGHVDSDIYTYDKALDDAYDNCEKTHVVIDPSSAIVLSAIMNETPGSPVPLEAIDPEEAQMVSDALEAIDWTLVDRAMTAAASKSPSAGNNQDGVDTPDERSARASSQVRDAGGLFAKAGNRVVVGGDAERGSGEITAVDNATGKVSVKLDSGNTIDVDAKQTAQEGGRVKPAAPFRDFKFGEPLDVSGILGEPRTPINQPAAHLPGTLPPMTREMLGSLLNDWGKYVSSQRSSYKSIDSKDEKRISDRYDAADPITAAGPEVEKALDPETSDVTPKYLAIVTQEDPSAVMDLVAIVPKTAASTEPATYKREEGKWVSNDQVLMDLKSATPPPVVELAGADLNNVLKQVDGIVNVTASGRMSLLWQKDLVSLVASLAATTEHAAEDPCWDGYKQIGFKDKNGKHVPNCVKAASAVAAAGGLDRNRGNAEELRQYWTTGKGAAKIRWGTPGDWTRCVRHLSKYMGVRAKGYCQLRHKEATGVYTGSRMNPGNEASSYSSETFDLAIIEASALAARAAEVRERFTGLVASAGDAGSKFIIPLLIPENMESGDGRKFDANAIEIRELPLPLLWQIKTGEGHNGSVVVGRIDYMERIENGIGNAYGVFDTGPYGREAERLVRNGFIRGVSADLDQFEAKEDKPEVTENAEGPEDIGKQKLTINHARVMAATIVAKPAFQECTISVEDNAAGIQEETMVPEDGIYEESVDTFVAEEALIASGFLDSEIPVTPPTEWFQNPGFKKATPMTIDPDGKIYGHIAAWHVNHIGMPRSTRPPRSKSKYAYFHTGVVRTLSGADVPVGQLTLAGGHASLQADARAAAKHYDDTASAIADVHAGEDDYGIWVSGSLRPDATEAQIRALRASAPSGDWRPINGQLELVAVCQVNVPGFPIARALVASGKVFALVAAGAHYMAVMKSDAVMSLVERANRMSELSMTTAALDIDSRLAAAKHKVWADFAALNRDQRMALAEEGKALPDGSFPIQNVEDLRNGIQAYGRAKESHKADVKKHIKKRARQLNARHLVPEEWNKESSMLASAKVDELRHKALIAAAAAELSKISGEELESLIASGGAMPNGMLPIRNEGDLKNALQAYNLLKGAACAPARKHITKRARALKQFNLIPQEWKSASTREAAASVEKMRSVIASITELADTPKEISESDLEKLKEVKAEADKQTEEEIKIAEDIRTGKTTAKEVYDEEGRSKYTPVTQPRDARGKYRKVLARLKQNLGATGLQDALQKVQHAEDMDFAGNYLESTKASTELLGLIDRIDSKALNAESLENVKATAAELGKVISNLPLPFGSENDKLKFSDLPAGLKSLMKDMITRVEAKIGKEDGAIATQELKSYMSGADVYSQAEVQSQMATLLRLLT